MEQAENASYLPLIERLKTYSFINRYTKRKKGSEKNKNIIERKNKETKNKKGDGIKQLNKKRAKGETEGKKPKKFKRIFTISTMSTDDNISVLLQDVDWENDEKLDLDV